VRPDKRACAYALRTCAKGSARVTLRVSLTIIVLAYLVAQPSSAYSHAYHPGATEPITTAPGLKLARIGKFRYPAYVTSDPQSSSRLYVVEQEGLVKIRDGGTTLARPFLDISDLVRYRDSETERGLFSIAFAPDYATSRLFYVAYSQNDGDIRVDELKRAHNDPSRATRYGRRKVIEIEHSEYATHNGGQLQFGSDGFLYLSTGDGGGHGSLLDPLGTGQNLKSLLGKLLRIDPRRPTETRGYSIPTSNPFFGPDGRRDEIWAYGLRNPWRFSFNPKNGNLWLSDVGAKSAEEINFSPAPVRGRGYNFGWSCYEGSVRLSDCRAPGHRPPLFQYDHEGDSCAITGGYVVRDRAVPALRGRYLYGDYCTGALHALRRTSTGVENAYLGLVVPKLTTFGEDAQGRVYAASRQGTVYRLEATP
jgi:glucose/arabinose dehydrogenase